MLHHVKRHQDKKQPITKLPHKAQLNIICNKKAQEALKHYPENSIPHPTLPASYLHLKIKRQTIIWQYQEYLSMQSSSTTCLPQVPTPEIPMAPTHHTYDRMENHQICHAKFSSLDQLKIQKMIHKWTPTRISPGNSLAIITDTLCPTCQHHPETPAHLHQCNHPKNTIYQTQSSS